MLDLQKEKLELVRGGCYCYCFKYPYSAFNVWPLVGVGQKKDEETCKGACTLERNKKRGYYAYSDCTMYPMVEAQPTPEYREFINSILESRASGWTPDNWF